MLVYPDSAHFDYLERASPSETARFQTVWSKAGCELVLSLHHLQEIAQLADGPSIARRLETIRLFPIVRGVTATSDLAVRFEIQAQIIELLGYGINRRRSAVDTLFPAASFQEVAAAFSINRPILRRMREPLQMAADASNLTKGQQRPSLRRRIPQDEASRLSARQLALHALEGHPPEVQELALELFDRVESQVTGTGTIRAALETLYELTTVSARRAILDPDLAAMSGFFQTARDQVGDVSVKLGIDPDRVLEAVESLEPYACPGFALQLAARRARGSHMKPDQPGDEVDLAHLAFAPHVDLLFADKRTVAFIQQEASKPQGNLIPRLTENVKRVGSLAQMEAHILECSDAV